MSVDVTTPRTGVEEYGLKPEADVHWDLGAPQLYEHALATGDARLSATGALAVETGQHTGRSPRDRYVVREPSSEGDIWWGDVNPAIETDLFDALRDRVVARLSGSDLWVQDLTCGADAAHAIAVRVVTESPWHSLFARNMFLPGRSPTPDWTVLHAPTVTAIPESHGTRTPTFVLLNFARREVLIGGTRYAGEIKKSIFSVMNYRLPAAGVLPMHCSANVGPDGDVALFFGLSGTGKTTLSTDPGRPMIGDDEHGWSDNGVFNFEGGSYAKVIRISEADEPLIYRATNAFGTILENVVLDPLTRTPLYHDDSLTENTRSAYPLASIGNTVTGGRAGHAGNVVFLTADAFGILPPIARLSRQQAMYYFLAGYTAKLAGTEGGVKEPQATFSPCFGAPFLPRHPQVYADLLGRRVEEHGASVWLVNTGWTGGPYGTGGRVPIPHTRRMLHAALNGDLDAVATRTDPVFGVRVPQSVPGVPDNLLTPRDTWDRPDDYDVAAARLAGLFHEHFAPFASAVSDGVRTSGPRVAATTP